MTAPRRAPGLDGKLRLARVLVGSICLAATSACGFHADRSGNVAGASPSTTAVLQAAVPFAVTVTPSAGPPGTAFHFHVTGAVPSDPVTFSIAAKGGHPYTGPAHSPAADGSVSATYATFPADTVGTYVVLAHSASGKGAFASFRVDAAAPPPAAP
jgi:hypothetical protein